MKSIHNPYFGFQCWKSFLNFNQELVHLMSLSKFDSKKVWFQLKPFPTFPLFNLNKHFSLAPLSLTHTHSLYRICLSLSFSHLSLSFSFSVLCLALNNQLSEYFKYITDQTVRNLLLHQPWAKYFIALLPLDHVSIL